MRRDYYAVLGVVSTAGPREVRHAYQRLARQYSPDINFWDAQARALFEEIAEAYRVLSDPAARSMYDRFGAGVLGDDALPAGRRGEDAHVAVELDFSQVVRARVRERPSFRRKGESVHCEVPISVWEALLGARIRVPTPAAEAVLVVPPGATGGQVFRLRGQGLPKLAGEGTGDLYVTIRVEMPTGLDARTQDLVRQLERLMPAEPRAALARFRGGAAWTTGASLAT